MSKDAPGACCRRWCWSIGNCMHMRGPGSAVVGLWGAAGQPPYTLLPKPQHCWASVHARESRGTIIALRQHAPGAFLTASQLSCPTNIWSPGCAKLARSAQTEASQETLRPPRDPFSSGVHVSA